MSEFYLEYNPDTELIDLVWNGIPIETFNPFHDKLNHPEKEVYGQLIGLMYLMKNRISKIHEEELYEFLKAVQENDTSLTMRTSTVIHKLVTGEASILILEEKVDEFIMYNLKIGTETFELLDLRKAFEKAARIYAGQELVYWYYSPNKCILVTI